MNIIILICVTAAIVFQSVAKKQYNTYTGGKGAYIFNSVTTLTAAIFFLLTDKGGFQFRFALIPYILGFAVCYGSAILFSFLAIREGFMSLTSLATSYSLIIPTLYGLLFLKEKAGALLVIGLVFLFLSLFLVNGKKGASSGLTVKWLIFALLAFLGNGLCSTVQTAQQRAFSGEYKSEFMIIALLILAVFFGIIAAVKEKEVLRLCINKSWITLLNGTANGFTNLFVMVLSRRMPASIMFPVISGGGLILTSLISIFIYKEKLSKRQYIGLILGTVSVVLMNI